MRQSFIYEYCSYITNSDISKRNVKSHADLDRNTPTNPAALDVLDSRSSTPDIDESILTMGDDIACSCDILTLQAIETSVRHWQKDWGSEDLWNASYQEALTFAQALGEEESAEFNDECEKHAWEGRMILDNIRDVVHTNCLCCRNRLKYDSILLFDLLVFVTSQVKFFEVKLDSGSL